MVNEWNLSIMLSEVTFVLCREIPTDQFDPFPRINYTLRGEGISPDRKKSS